MDANEMTVEDMIDALGELEDEELDQLRAAVADEITDREAGEDLDEGEEEEEEEDFDE